MRAINADSELLQVVEYTYSDGSTTVTTKDYENNTITTVRTEQTMNADGKVPVEPLYIAPSMVEALTIAPELIESEPTVG